MGVSLSNCYQKNSQAQIQDDCGAKSVEDDGKKLVLRSNPKRYLNHIMNLLYVIPVVSLRR